jgi:hypothetical protein
MEEIMSQYQFLELDEVIKILQNLDNNGMTRTDAFSEIENRADSGNIQAKEFIEKHYPWVKEFNK